MNFSIYRLVAVLILLALIPSFSLAAPLKACLKSDSGKVIIKRRCKAKKGQTEISAEILQGLGATQVGPTGPAGPAGPQGPQGEQGIQGPAGATNVVLRENTSISNDLNGVVSVLCETGEVAIGGGLGVSAGNIAGVQFFYPGGLAINENFGPTTDGETPRGWQGSWYNGNNNNNTWRVFVLCASP